MELKIHPWRPKQPAQFDFTFSLLVRVKANDITVTQMPYFLSRKVIVKCDNCS